ncbi:Uncharacterized protein Adt_24610 [Abeliophyllum distichum]|uniref:Uncharacterized protein n=1 Tax=Abeliophyllum distichum TaxID=126358 RepID=A0ABD1SE95_9LAMI
MAIPPCLSGDRYVTSLAVLHSIMVDHLEELDLEEVSTHLKEQILVHKREKEEMVVYNKCIFFTINTFFLRCSKLEPGSSEMVKKFHQFMKEVLDVSCMDEKYVKAFLVRSRQVKEFNHFKSIQNVSSFLQGVKYDGEGRDVKDDETMEAEEEVEEGGIGEMEVDG